MAACDHCGKVVSKVTLNNNGRTQLRLCAMCQAEFDLKRSDSLSPAYFSTPQPWYKRWWRKLRGK